MATVQPTVASGDSSEGVKVITWTGVNGGDTCLPFRLGRYNLTTLQIVGTPTGAALTGSNDGVNFTPISDWTGTAISGINAAGIKTPRDMPVWIQPTLTTGTAINFVVAAHRTDMSSVG